MASTTLTFLDILDEYSVGQDPGAVANVRSALFRCYGKGLQGRKTKKTRFTKEMLIRMERTLEKHPIDLSNFDPDYHLQIFEKGCDLLNITETNKRSLRSYFKRLLDFIDLQYINPSPKVPENVPDPLLEVHTVRQKIMDKSYIEEQKIRKPKNPKMALSSNPEDFLDRLQRKYPDRNKKDLLLISEKNLERLEQDNQSYSQFQKQENIRNVSIEKRQQFFARLLGKWYEQNPDKTIEDVSLQSLIPVIDSNVDRGEMNYDMTAIYVREGRLRDEAKKLSETLIKFLNKFFRESGVSSSNTANNYIDSLTSYAKFLYQDITDRLEYDDYEDIAVIRYLRVQRKRNRNLFDKGQRQQHLPLTWDEVMNVMYALKKDYDTERYEYIYTRDNGKQYIGKHEKTDEQKAKQLQAFLIIISFGIIPPKRQRIIRELTFGKTLKYGKLDVNGHIMPLDPENDEVNEGNYILDLSPDDHKNGSKTGKSYREIIPNRKFKDGTFFYDYLNEWLLKYRQVLLKTDAQTVFIREIKGDAFTKDSVWQKINSIFKTKTGVSVNPHLLRHIFVTFLANDEVEFAKRKAAAMSMGHDPITADKYYCKQTDEQAIQPITEYMDNLWSSDLDLCTD